MTIFSFHPVKIITTGEGGMAMTNSVALADRMKLLRSHGITKNFNDFERKDMGAWHYEQQELGYNYRMNDIELPRDKPDEEARKDCKDKKRTAITIH